MLAGTQHVAYVDNFTDGTISISEYNWNWSYSFSNAQIGLFSNSTRSSPDCLIDPKNKIVINKTSSPPANTTPVTSVDKALYIGDFIEYSNGKIVDLSNQPTPYQLKLGQSAKVHIIVKNKGKTQWNADYVLKTIYDRKNSKTSFDNIASIKSLGGYVATDFNSSNKNPISKIKNSCNKVTDNCYEFIINFNAKSTEETLNFTTSKINNINNNWKLYKKDKVITTVGFPFSISMTATPKDYLGFNYDVLAFNPSQQICYDFGCFYTPFNSEPIPTNATKDYRLDVVPVGDGIVKLSNDSTGIDCTSQYPCNVVISENSPLKLEAIATNGANFTGWGNTQCNNTSNVCQFTLNGAKQFSPQFSSAKNAIKNYRLNVTPNNGGTIKVSNGSTTISCTNQSPCSNISLSAGTVLTLDAVYDSNTKFNGWGISECSNTANSCRITLNADKQVSPQFTVLSKTFYTLTINMDQHPIWGNVIVKEYNNSTTPASVTPIATCEQQKCTISIREGTNITLSTNAKTGYLFQEWNGGGECQGVSQMCQFTMTGNRDTRLWFVPKLTANPSVELTSFSMVSDLNGTKTGN